MLHLQYFLKPPWYGLLKFIMRTFSKVGIKKKKNIFSSMDTNDHVSGVMKLCRAKFSENWDWTNVNSLFMLTWPDGCHINYTLIYNSKCLSLVFWQWSLEILRDSKCFFFQDPFHPRKNICGWKCPQIFKMQFQNFSSFSTAVYVPSKAFNIGAMLVSSASGVRASEKSWKQWKQSDAVQLSKTRASSSFAWLRRSAGLQCLSVPLQPLY